MKKTKQNDSFSRFFKFLSKNEQEDVEQLVERMNRIVQVIDDHRLILSIVW